MRRGFLGALLVVAMLGLGCKGEETTGNTAPPPTGTTAGTVQYRCASKCGKAPVSVSTHDPAPQCCGSTMVTVP